MCKLSIYSVRKILFYTFINVYGIYNAESHSFAASAPTHLFRVLYKPCLARLLPTDFYPLHLPCIIHMPSLTVSYTVS